MVVIALIKLKLEVFLKNYQNPKIRMQKISKDQCMGYGREVATKIKSGKKAKTGKVIND